ncbi:unnamed protein product [Pedinophyceae sp. YPF-701]|nr:unnamed protein product [Pedinophyceae sp. YPF-701]
MSQQRNFADIAVQLCTDLRHASEERALAAVRDAVEYLDSAGLPVYALTVTRDELDWPLTLLAAKRGHVTVLEALVDAGCHLNDSLPASGNTVLHVAAMEGHLRVLKFVLEKAKLLPRTPRGHECLSVDVCNKNGDAPLHFALASQQIAAAATLLHAGASPRAFNFAGLTALMCAANSGQPACVSLVLRAIPVAEHADQLRRVDVHGNTALHFACGAGAAQVARLLLDAGADLFVRNKAKQTPLQAAEAAGAEAVVALVQPLWEEAVQRSEEAKAALERDEREQREREERRQTKQIKAGKQGGCVVAEAEVQTDEAVQVEAVSEAPSDGPSDGEEPGDEGLGGAGLQGAWARQLQHAALNDWGRGSEEGEEDAAGRGSEAGGARAPAWVKEAQARMAEVCPRAMALDLQPRHVLGVGVAELSLSQLDALLELHQVAVREVHEAQMAAIRKQERSRLLNPRIV